MTHAISPKPPRVMSDVIFTHGYTPIHYSRVLVKEIQKKVLS